MSEYDGGYPRASINDSMNFSSCCSLLVIFPPDKFVWVNLFPDQLLQCSTVCVVGHRRKLSLLLRWDEDLLKLFSFTFNFDCYFHATCPQVFLFTILLTLVVVTSNFSAISFNDSPSLCNSLIKITSSGSSLRLLWFNQYGLSVMPISS